MRLTQLASCSVGIVLLAIPNLVVGQSTPTTQPPESMPPATSTQADVPVLELVCHGNGSHSQLGVNALLAFSGRRSAQAVGVTNTNIQGPDTVRLRIQGQDSTIRLPRELYAGKFHNGTNDGWLKLIQVEKRDTEIKAKIDLFFTSHPQVQIDRDTGDIEINGNGDFSYTGNCQQAQAELQRRF